MQPCPGRPSLSHGALSDHVHPWSLTSRTWNGGWKTILSYWEGNFSGAMFNFRGVVKMFYLLFSYQICHPQKFKGWPSHSFGLGICSEALVSFREDFFNIHLKMVSFQKAFWQGGEFWVCLHVPLFRGKLFPSRPSSNPIYSRQQHFCPTAIALGSSAIVKVSGQNCFRTLCGSLGQIRVELPKGSAEGSTKVLPRLPKFCSLSGSLGCCWGILWAYCYPKIS